MIQIIAESYNMSLLYNKLCEIWQHIININI